MEKMQGFQAEGEDVHVITDKERQEIEGRMSDILKVVKENAERVAKLGEWPEYVDLDSLMERVPSEMGKNVPGFDAGIACALGMIPEEKQKLAAMLHAHYTKEAVMQVREEVAELDPDSATAWWLAACSVCREGEIDAREFLKQIEDFEKIALDKDLRNKAAKKEYSSMTSSFTLRDGIPFGEKDGCIQGAYIAGYPFGTLYAENYGLYFIGTYEDSLGLEDFSWSEEKDEKGRAKSGPVFGSKQFVKCASEDEWKRVMAVVKKKFPFQEGID